MFQIFLLVVVLEVLPVVGEADAVVHAVRVGCERGLKGVDVLVQLVRPSLRNEFRPGVGDAAGLDGFHDGLEVFLGLLGFMDQGVRVAGGIPFVVCLQDILVVDSGGGAESHPHVRRR